MNNIRQVTKLLKYTYGLVPIVAGADKFFNILTDWGVYLSSGLMNALPIEPILFMQIIGVVEIMAGVLVLFRVSFGSLVVCGWLVLIALILILSGSFLDVVVRDLVMAIGAFSLYRLSTISTEENN